FRVGPVADVYVAPADGSAEPTRLTAGEENTFLVAWTPDSRAVLVSQDRGGDERDRLYRVDLDRPLDLRLLTDDEPNYFLHGGDDVKCAASWFPDGRRLLVTADTPTHVRVGVWELPGGEVRWLLDDPARNIEAAFVPHGSERIVVIDVQDARGRPSLLDPAT